MIRLRYLFISALFAIVFCKTLFSQGIAIGEWRDHLPYNNCISITEGVGKIYCATKYAVFSYDKNDESLERLTKVNYLSDVGVSRVMFNNVLHLLLVTYTNGNIDIMDNDKNVINISDIKRKPLAGNKSINNILMIGKLAYLSCGFGIVVLDMEKKEIKDTYYIGPNGSVLNILDLDTDGEKLFAATESGIYSAELSCPYLSNFSYWTKDEEMIHPDLSYNSIACFHGDLYVNFGGENYDDDTLFKYDGTWKHFDSLNYANKYGVNVFNDRLIIVDQSDVKFFDSDGDELGKIYSYPFGNPSPRDVIIDKDSMVWSADQFLGIVRTWDIFNSSYFLPQGPFSANVVDMAVEGSNLWVAPGGMDGTWNNLYSHDGLFSFTNEEWDSYYYATLSAFDTIYDVVSVAVNPENPSIAYAGTWCRGIMEFTNKQLTEIYDESNSTLMGNGVSGGGYRLRVSSMVFDSDNNMWVANSGVSTGLNVRMNNGTWKSFNIGSYTNNAEVGDIAIDNNNKKWIILPRTNGLLVYDDNNTITNASDDQIKKLSNNAGYGGLPSNNLFSIAVDLDGEVWIGSDKGVAVFYNPENVFSGNDYDAQQILVDQDGYIQPLLESETITAIAVDGSNKKWIGTSRAGVFLMSADGTEEIEHFTEENSPLFSNTINAIAIDQKTGEVYFGTDKGIVSYKSTATLGTAEDTSIVVFPNPVPSGYTGYIAIRGLAKDSDVKITDISGTLIYQTIAEGGQAVWNGKNFEGEKAQTGVYLAFCSNEDGSRTVVAKIMIIN